MVLDPRETLHRGSIEAFVEAVSGQFGVRRPPERLTSTRYIADTVGRYTGYSAA